MRYVIALSSLAVSCGGVTQVGDVNAAGAQAQCEVAWSRPDTLRTRVGAPLYIDRPVGAISIDEEILVLGPQVAFGPGVLDASGPPPTSLELDPSLALGGFVGSTGLTRLIQRPPFLRNISTLWLFPSGRYGFHAVWGVPRDSSRPAEPEVRSVWYARFDGERWGRPEMVLTAGRIDWWHGVSAAVALNDQIVVAAPAVDSGWSGILTAHRTASGWVPNRVPIRAGLAPRGVALAAITPHPVMFYHDAVSPGAGEAIYLRELSFSSGEWGAERLVDSLPAGGLNWPLAVQSSDKTVHLAFAFTGENATESLVHLSSPDLTSWRVHHLPLNARVLDLDVAAGATSGIHIVMQTALFSGVATTSSTPAGLATLEQLPFATPIGTGPNLVPIGRDTMIMTWTTRATRAFNNNPVSFPVTLVSRRTRTCR